MTAWWPVAKEPKIPEDNIWSFNYKKGPAPMSAHVRAKDERTAMAVATRWCESQNARPPAKMFPFIVADETILTIPVGEAEAELPTDEVGATTGTGTGK